MTDAPARPRIAFLSWSNALFDSRTHRMARSAMAAGYDVAVYARWEPGTRLSESRDGYRILRVPVDWRMAFPPTRGWGRRRLAGVREAPASRVGGDPASAAPAIAAPVMPAPPIGRVRRFRRWLARQPGGRWGVAILRQVLIFPIRPVAWAVALEEVAEPADLWHGMWAGSLPASSRLRRRLGGRSIYDSRDVLLESRGFVRLPRVLVALLRRIERRWARRADAVITVNDAYAGLVQGTLGVRVAAVVRNCPERGDGPGQRGDLIRKRLGLGRATRVVLYQGQLMTERGVEEGMDAILSVPDAVLVLLGFGAQRDAFSATASREPYRGRVHLIDAVPPSELVAWTASADVALMAIQPTTINHRYTTPNKLWEALAAGTPIVASDLPGMAEVIRETGAGVLCDPTSPASIAAAIRSLVDLPADRLEVYRAAALAAARDRYNWEAQAGSLLALYERLLGGRR